MEKTLIIGVGNKIMGDDGIAHYVIEALQKFPMPVNHQTAFIGTNVWKIAPLAKDYGRIIIVDGVVSNNDPGSIYFIPANKLATNPQPYSLHDFTVFDVLAMLGLLEKTYLFGIEINTLYLDTEISPVLKEKTDYFAAKLYQILLKKAVR